MTREGRLSSTMKLIRKIADGRRHYDGGDGYDCFAALGDVRLLCDSALGDLDAVSTDDLDILIKRVISEGDLSGLVELVETRDKKEDG